MISSVQATILTIFVIAAQRTVAIYAGIDSGVTACPCGHDIMVVVEGWSNADHLKVTGPESVPAFGKAIKTGIPVS